MQPPLVYLDYAATTPVDPVVAAAMSRHLGPGGVFGNAASHTHGFGRAAAEAVENARAQVAELVGGEPHEIIWTSGATESTNLAIKGTAHANAERGRHIITSSMEHKATLDSCAQLASQGFDVSYVAPDDDGLITPERVVQTIRDDTILVSLMHVNNETGTVTDVGAIGEVVRDRGVLFHVDAAQSAARLPLDANAFHADFISLSGHKIYGPKGVGALYVRRDSRKRITAQMHGGGHEQGLRAGTLPTHQIVGMGEAARLVNENRVRDMNAVAELEARMLDRILDAEQVFLNGNQARRVPGIVGLGFACVESETLMLALPEIALSAGSACTSASVEPSHVLRALGVSDARAGCSIRISLGRFTTPDEVEYAGIRICDKVEMLRQLSPDWQAWQAERAPVDMAARRAA